MFSMFWLLVLLGVLGRFFLGDNLVFIFVKRKEKFLGSAFIGHLLGRTRTLHNTTLVMTLHKNLTSPIANILKPIITANPFKRVEK